VVEDDKQLASALRRGLEVEGYAVDVAPTGTDGEWLANENTYDAMVVDVMLPGLAGDALCTGRRDRGDWTPILMVTARSGPASRTPYIPALGPKPGVGPLGCLAWRSCWSSRMKRRSDSCWSPASARTDMQ
jgi:CheY-like chemotaxis protein